MTVPAEQAPRPHLRVHASASVEVGADRAHLPVTLHADGTSSARAAAALRRRYAKLRSALTRCDAVVSAVHVLGCTAENTEGQSHAQMALRVDVRDVAGLPSVYRALASVPELRVGAARWQLNPDHPVYAMLWRDAVRAARGKADVLAGAGGMRVHSLEWMHCGSARCDLAAGDSPDGGEAVPAALLSLTEAAALQVSVSLTGQYTVGE